MKQKLQSDHNQSISTQRLLTVLKEAREKLEVLDSRQNEPVAIIGIGCRFPGGADNPEAYWDLLSNGEDAISEVPGDRWNIDDYYDADPNVSGKMYTRFGGFIKDVDYFDPQLFGISPREAKRMDPQQRLLLEVSREALQHAHLVPEELSGSSTGIFLGISSDDYFGIRTTEIVDDPTSIDTHTGLGSSRSIAAGRLAYTFNFHGPTLQLDTSCSSSLLAVHLACQSLRSGESSLALAGGVHLMLSPEATINFCKLKALSPDGRCKTFDASADGYSRGEGCGIVVLKLLSAAISDGDPILAQICGSAANHDGRSNGLTAPNGTMQEAVIARAIKRANVQATDIGYVEVHGTGTPLGDPIEVNALSKVLGDGRSLSDTLYLGSVKTNFGHLEGAAGVAGLIKTVLALQHHAIPPHLHFHKPNPYISWEKLPVKVNTQLLPWPIGKQRLAGVSSFGMSGTNVHIIMGEAPSRDTAAAVQSPGIKRPMHILRLSAHKKEALEELAKRYQYLFTSHAEDAVVDLCHAANTRSSEFQYRLVLSGSGKQDFIDKLDAYVTGQVVSGAWSAQIANKKKPKIAFLFTGQGSQYPQMGRMLFDTQPVFRKSLQYCDEILRPIIGISLVEVLYPAGDETGLIDQTAFTQPALFALQISLAKLWRSWGIEPSVVLGHSVGEYSAACVAGVMSIEDGLQLVAERARLMQALPKDGEMVVVFAGVDAVLEQIETFADVVSIAAINGPESTVISGKKGAIRVIQSTLHALGMRTQKLNVSHAFHSPLMEPVLAELAQVASSKRFSIPKIPVISNLTGEAATAGIFTPEYWCRHAREPVRFAAGVNHLKDNDMILEIGPKPTLSILARQCIQNFQGIWLNSLREGQNDWQVLLKSLAEMHTHGLKVDWKGFDQCYGIEARKVNLPTYPYQKKQFPVRSLVRQPGKLPRENQKRDQQAWVHPLIGKPLGIAGKTTVFESVLSASSPSYIADHQIHETIVLPGAACMEMAIAAASQVLHTSSILVEDVIFQSPLTLSNHDEKTVQTVVSNDTPEFYSVEVYSRITDDRQGPTWKLHAAAKVAKQSRPGHTLMPITELKTRCAQRLDVDKIYEQFQRRGYNYGPGFKAVRQLWCGINEALGEIHLDQPVQEHGQQYFLHPALLDSCFHVVAAALAQQENKSTMFIPLGAERLRCYRPAGKMVWSYARVLIDKTNDTSLAADLMLLNEAGQVVAEIECLQFVRTRREEIESVQTKKAPSTKTLSYILKWRPLPLVTVSPEIQTSQTTWLIFADQGGVGKDLAALLRNRREACFIVEKGESFTVTDPYHCIVNPNNPEQFTRLLDEVCRKEYVQQLGILYLWNLDAQTDYECDGKQVLDQQVLYCSSILHLVQSLAHGEERQFASRLWLTTSGVHAVDQQRSTSLNVSQSSLWGLGRVIAVEHPEMQCVCIDLDPECPTDPGSLLQEILENRSQENQVAFRHGQRWVSRLVQHTLQQEHHYSIRPEATYLVTGGLGALGLRIAEWLVSMGAKHLLLTGRNGFSNLPKHREEKLEELRRRGVRIQVVSGDVTSLSDVQKVFEQAQQYSNPLAGVVHAAGLTDDDWLLNLDRQRFRDVMAPKISGTWNLHLLTRDIPLDFFICFSSISAIVGSPGQGNYAAGNAFMDAVVQSRRLQGQAGLSVNWGPWAGGGLASDTRLDWAAAGITKIQPEEAFESLQKMKAGPAQVTVADVDWEKFIRSTQFSPLLKELVDAQKPGSNSLSPFAVKVASAPPSSHYNLLLEEVQLHIARVLNLDTRDILPDQDFLDMGLDSLTAVELRNLLQSSLGRPLSLTAAFRYPNLQALADYLAQEMGILKHSEPLLHMVTNHVSQQL